jgi:formylglycine-generating enzyme required for sulfatase activity
MCDPCRDDDAALAGSSITPRQANYNYNNGRYMGGTCSVVYPGGVNREKCWHAVLVDSFDPNPWGLYNLHGNAWEWTEDCLDDSSAHPGDGRASTAGDCVSRVLRGGSIFTPSKQLRAAERAWDHPSNKNLPL